MDVTTNMMRKPQVSALYNSLGQCGEVVSAFLKPRPLVAPPTGNLFPVASFARLDEFQMALDALGSLQHDQTGTAELNRLEFEGSLTQLLLDGGCHRSPHLSLTQARSIVESALDAIFPQPFERIGAYRFDSSEWSTLTRDATVSHTYFAYCGARGLWWFLCVADFD